VASRGRVRDRLSPVSDNSWTTLEMKQLGPRRSCGSRPGQLAELTHCLPNCAAIETDVCSAFAQARSWDVLLYYR